MQGHRNRALAVVIAIAAVACSGGSEAGTDGASSGGSPAPPEPTQGTAEVVVVIDPGDGGDYQPTLRPHDVVERIDNPYFPLEPGSRWVYEGTSDGEAERIEVKVLSERREVMGMSAVVVRDTVTINGELAEDTHDWYVQDVEGTVWYLGEDTAEYDNGVVVNHNGAWEAGVDGALPGIAMPADPQVGDAYRQEFYDGEAEDLAEVLRIEPDLVILEWTPLEPETVEEKTYERGVGFVAGEKVEGGEGSVELVEHTAG